MSGETIVPDPWWKRYRSALAACESRRFEVFFRSLAPSPGAHSQHKRIIDRLDDVASGDQIDGYDITVLGEQLCLCDTCRGTQMGEYLHERLEELREWRGGGARPLSFNERMVQCSITDEEYTILEPPNVTLAVYGDEELQGVFPAQIEGRAVGVLDFLEGVESVPIDIEPSAVDA